MQGTNTAQQYSYDQSQAGKTTQQQPVSYRSKTNLKDRVVLCMPVGLVMCITEWLKCFLQWPYDHVSMLNVLSGLRVTRMATT